MTVFFTHTSALAFWRQYREFKHCRPKPRRISAYPNARFNRTEVADAAQAVLPFGTPLHVAVGSTQSRVKVDGLHLHRWRRFGSSTSYVEVAPEVLVASPALMLTQMSDLLNFEYLVELAFELAGSFSPSSIDLRGFCDAPPLLEPAQVASQLRCNPGGYGTQKTLRALQYTLADAASPREAIAAMLLCLPMRYGGYGLPPAKLNTPISLSKHSQGNLRRGQIRCDLYWPDHKVALEYESDQWHTGPGALARDSERRNDLRSLGIDVITLTNNEMKSRHDLDKINGVLCKLLHHHNRVATAPGFVQRQIQLRSHLLDSRVRAGAEHLINPASN